MSLFLYNIFLWFYNKGIRIASLYNPKARRWVKGRKDILQRLKNTIPPNEKTIWFHCASLGEFEQGRSVIEKLKSQYKSYKILLTFFSPSGYEVQKKYDRADWVFYLPLDGPRIAKKFLEIVQPELVVFVKYEYWYYYLKKINEQKIPLVLISALFRRDMIFFKWYGSIYKKMLSRFDHLFVQDYDSKKLIDSIGLTERCSVSGDTRFDRVIEIASSFKAIPEIENFLKENKCIVAGSTWYEDEVALQKAMSKIKTHSLKLIIAPHEVNENHINEIEKLFPNSIRFSQLKNRDYTLLNILIIDNIGMLSQLYKYATIAYIGGGLKTSGVHNVLEAAVYGKPVLFGSFYQQYAEAIELVKADGGLPFNDKKKDGIMLAELVNALLINQEEYEYRCKASTNYVQSNKGATENILNYIQEKRLLTS